MIDLAMSVELRHVFTPGRHVTWRPADSIVALAQAGFQVVLFWALLQPHGGAKGTVGAGADQETVPTASDKWIPKATFPKATGTRPHIHLRHGSAVRGLVRRMGADAGTSRLAELDVHELLPDSASPIVRFSALAAG